MISAIELTKETLSFLDALFIYKWTQSKDDLQKLINIFIFKDLELRRRQNKKTHIFNEKKKNYYF